MSYSLFHHILFLPLGLLVLFPVFSLSLLFSRVGMSLEYLVFLVESWLEQMHL